MKNALPLFETQPVHRAAVKITRAGDGLSEALKVDPVPLPLGSDVFFVLKGQVVDIDHKLKDDVITRIHTIDTTQITTVAAEDVEKLLLAAAEKLEAARANAEGQPALGDDE